MAYIDKAIRLVRPLGADENVIWLDGTTGRFGPGSILRLMEREVIGADGELRRNVPFELVVVTERRSPFSLVVDRAQYGTIATDYPPGSVIDALAETVYAKDRPIYHGFEDI